MSTLTGTANFALERVPEDYQPIYTIAVGSINILAGVITTVAQFLRLNELAEAHRVASVAWDKFYRNIHIELIKCPSERTDVKYVLKISKDEFDRLAETSPNIEADILKKFTKSLTSGVNKPDCTRRKTLYENLNKPQLFNEIVSIRELVYKPNEAEELKTQEETQRKQEELARRQQQILIRQETMRDDRLQNFITQFKNQHNRPPTDIEIANNLNDNSSPQLRQDRIVIHRD